ncbi:hypothetical protein [Proteiniphilum sp. X52]|uniref:hypothetical protein n=1 Tax=Proteiniphilum sp. X52 TaxID=2382159 RepID=UPI0011CE608B|nr:hypothetical protein [Proteiniphilum sp. X52]
MNPADILHAGRPDQCRGVVAGMMNRSLREILAGKTPMTNGVEGVNLGITTREQKEIWQTTI